MRSKPITKIIKGAIVFTITAALCFQISHAQSTTYRLDNGMEVILKEQHGSPMVASMLFVKSGSKYETRYQNGITHFLEHLLFDGTTSLSREDLDNSIRDLGGYINAFTRKELTAYLVLLPSQYIDYGMTVQADMLFNSIIPTDELDKERKVVIEEINRDADSPGAPAEEFFTSHAYAGTQYARTVLGYKAFIENIPRQAVIDYWKQAYIPSNMTLLVIGDFATDSMKTMVQSVFGQFTDESVGLPPTSPQPDTTIIAPPQPITGQTVYDTVANVTSTYINFSFVAPPVHDSDYLAADLLSKYLGMDDISPLMKELKGGADPLATEASVSLTTYEEFTRMEISAVTSKAANADAIVAAIKKEVENAAKYTADPDVLQGIITTTRCENIYNSEKLHYLGFMIAPMMMTAGWDFIESYPARLAKLNWSDCQRAAKKWFSDPRFVATVVKPAEPGQVPYRPSVMTAEEVKAHFDSTTFSNYEPANRPVITFPTTEKVNYEYKDPAQYHREELANGLVVIVKSRPGDEVFAMNILGKNRTENEPEGKAGITDFVNRMIEKATVTRDDRELTRDLASIGANVTLYDNPWIPYDDRYTTRSFSFMKFETIDEFAKKGFHLFTEMILHPAFDSSDIENVRQSMLGVIGRNQGNTTVAARELFFKTLFGNSPFARPVTGDAASIGSITFADLMKYHYEYYSPDNMILTIVTGRPIPEVMGWVDRTFGRLMSTGFETKIPSVPTAPIGTVTAHKDMDKEQISIYLGGPLIGVADSEKSSLAVAMNVLSTRLYQNLREKQGLAYSVGATHDFDHHFGWYYCAIGTAAKNYQAALDGMNLHLEKLTFDGPTPEEISKSRNQIWGRLMSAKLSSINQAYYLGLNEFDGYDVHHDREFLSQLLGVDINSVRRTMSKYVRTGGSIVASAGKKP